MAVEIIGALGNDLQPVRRLDARGGALVVGGATVAAIIGVALKLGLRSDLMAVQPSNFMLLRAGILLTLGMAAAWGALDSARPAIGIRRYGLGWAFGMAALFPLITLYSILRDGSVPPDLYPDEMMFSCIGASLACATMVGVAMIWWLRKGASVHPRRSGWLTGLAAGSLGSFAYSLACPSSSMHFTAIWSSISIMVFALIGRLVAPRLLRW